MAIAIQGSRPHPFCAIREPKSSHEVHGEGGVMYGAAPDKALPDLDHVADRSNAPLSWKMDGPQGRGYTDEFCELLQDQIQIAEFVPKIFSRNRFFVGCANLFGGQKCAQ